MEPSYQLLRVEKCPEETLKTLAAQERLFAIVDACDAPQVPEVCEALGKSRAVSLYSGEAAVMYSDIAPYLFQVDAMVLDWLQQSLWHEPWGVFVVAPGSDLESLRKHFRQFLIVLDPEGEEMYFRFYDPRVLSTFLPTCLPTEITTLFGPVVEYGIVEDHNGEVCFWRKR